MASLARPLAPHPKDRRSRGWNARSITSGTLPSEEGIARARLRTHHGLPRA
jgi:hypothetical protein